MGTVLYHLLESIRFAAVMLKPFLPETSDKIFAQLNTENRGVESLHAFDGMLPGSSVGEASILFGRIDIPKMLKEIETEQEKKQKAASKDAKKAEKITEVPGVITIDDFAKVEMTVCKVLSCENVKKSEKLLKFQLDDGSGTPRQILSGIAMHYKAEELVGKTLVACTNLAPRKMMGQQSNGMLLSAVRDTGAGEELHLIMLSDEVPAGCKLC